MTLKVYFKMDISGFFVGLGSLFTTFRSSHSNEYQQLNKIWGLAEVAKIKKADFNLKSFIESRQLVASVTISDENIFFFRVSDVAIGCIAKSQKCANPSSHFVKLASSLNLKVAFYEETLSYLSSSTHKFICFDFQNSTQLNTRFSHLLPTAAVDTLNAVSKLSFATMLTHYKALEQHYEHLRTRVTVASLSSLIPLPQELLCVILDYGFRFSSYSFLQAEKEYSELHPHQI